MGSIGANGAFLGALAHCFDVFEVFIETADALAAVTIHDINIAIGRDGHVRRARPFEFL